MSCYIDTSAFLALLDAGDKNYLKAYRTWEKLLGNETPLVSSNYVLVETCALLQHRFGLQALRVFQDDIVPVIAIQWVEESIHQAGLMSVLTGGRRKLSLVDCVSFVIMRQMGAKSVFCFDKHFQEQGFQCIP